MDAAPLLAPEELDDRGSTRKLDDVGVGAVLEAMIEQRRRSSRPCPVAASTRGPSPAEIEPTSEDDPRPPAHSGAFLKAR